MRHSLLAFALVLLLLPPAARGEIAIQAYALPTGGGPHDVAVGADGIAWYTAQRSGQRGRVDPRTREVKRWPLPEARSYVNLNTLTFAKRGRVWFTRQNGVYGRLDPKS